MDTSPKRDRDAVTREEERPRRPQPTAEAAAPVVVRPNIEWADTIKRHHVNIRAHVDRCGGDVEAGWKAALADREALDAYANAMRNLATLHWEPSLQPPSEEPSDASCAPPALPPKQQQLGDGRYDDRLGYIVGAVRRFFVGCTDADRRVGLEPGPPLIVAAALKAEKRRHFEAHQRVMTAAESVDFVSKFMDAHVLPLAAETGAAQRVAVRVLDVGSCYNPLPARFAADGFTSGAEGCAARVGGGWGLHGPHLDVKVLGLDLTPHADAVDVVRGDWSRVDCITPNGTVVDSPTSHFFTTAERTDTRHWYDAFVTPAVPTDADPYRCVVQAESFHVVSFCLLLSYLPSPGLRARCVENAHRALRLHGLLVVVSTRTQGSRSKPDWIDDWVCAIEAVGFQRIKDVKKKIVGMTFQKCRPATTALDDATANKLRVIADDVV